MSPQSIEESCTIPVVLVDGLPRINDKHNPNEGQSHDNEISAFIEPTFDLGKNNIIL